MQAPSKSKQPIQELEMQVPSKSKKPTRPWQAPTWWGLPTITPTPQASAPNYRREQLTWTDEQPTRTVQEPTLELPQYLWTVPPRVHNHEIHAINGNPNQDQPRQPRCASDDRGNDQPSNDFETLHARWTTMLQQARKLKIFRLSAATAANAKTHLTHVTGDENTGQNAQDTRAIEIISTAICLASLDNWPIFTAALLGEKETFQAHCLSANSITAWVMAKEPDQDPNLTLEAFDRLWNLIQTTLQHVMALTRTKLARSENPILLYKSLQFQNERKMRLWITKLTE